MELEKGVDSALFEKALKIPILWVLMLLLTANYGII